ncbi:MAG TPA: hypothetical protein VF255_03240 [Solirubrobacterales bacterium]
MAAVRHGAANVLERCLHWMMILRQPDEKRQMTALEAIGELETELRLLEESFRQLSAILADPPRLGRDV